MARRDLLARYDELAERVPELEAAPTVALPTAVHAEVIALLDELLGMVPADSGPAGQVMRLLHRVRPVLLQGFARVPADKVAEALHQIGARMLAVGAEGVTDGDSGTDDGAADGPSEAVASAT